MTDIKSDLFYPDTGDGCDRLCIAVICIRIFLAIGQVNDYRSQLIQAGIEQNQKEIVLPILPYSEYCWQTVPPTEEWEKVSKILSYPQDVL